MPWGAIIGGVIGALGSSGGDSQTVQNSVPPEFSGLAGAVADRGMQFANMPFTPYPYSRVADFNPYQYMGFDMGANHALNSGLPGQANETLMNTLQGGYQAPNAANPYAGANPYLESAITSAQNDVTKQFNTQVAPNMAAAAMNSGSFGNSGFQEAEQNARDGLAQQLGNISTNMRMGDYTTQQGLAESNLNRQFQGWDSERNRMMGGLGLAGGVNALGYSGADYLQGIGGAIQQQGQNTLNDWYSRFQDSQNWPFRIYDAMMAPFGRNIGSTSTSTGAQGNPVAGLMGGAMMGNRVGNMFGGNNYFGGSGYTGAGTPVDNWSGMGYY